MIEDCRHVGPMSIGQVTVDPPVLQAPLAGYTDHAFRQITRQFGGVGLPVTEMLSARGILGADMRHERLPERLWGVLEEPRPLAVQIWDNDPDTLAAVGRRLAQEFGVSVVDINFGCPVRDVSEKAESGSYLLRFPDRIGRIVARVAAACAPVPVTAKIRLGATRDTINAIDVVQAIEGAGGAAVTVHGRTAADFFRGSFRRWPVDGVMVGRAALGRPWLFAQIQAALAGRPIPPDPSPDQQRQTVLDHYRLITDRYGIEPGTIVMRKHACCYTHGRPGGRAFRSIISQVRDDRQFLAAVDGLFSAAGGG